MQTRTLALAFVAAILVGSAAACGGGGKKASAPATTSSGSAAPPTTAPATPTTTGGTSFADAKNCAQLASLAAKVQRSVTPTGNGRVDMTREVDALNALADGAPDAIKGDFKTFADAFASFAKVYASSGFKAGTTPTAAQVAKLTSAAQKLSTPRVQGAIRHLETWGRTHCGGLTSTSP